MKNSNVENQAMYKVPTRIAIKRFTQWFDSSYGQLRKQLSVRGSLDEDTFHDTFLRMYQRIKRSGSIEDLTSYFLQSYQKNRLQRSLFEGKFCHPDPFFFEILSLYDESGEELEFEQESERLAFDILKFIKTKFSSEEYRLFRLNTVEPGCSCAELVRYTGMPYSHIYRRMSAIKKAVLKQNDFVFRSLSLSMHL